MSINWPSITWRDVAFVAWGVALGAAASALVASAMKPSGALQADGTPPQNVVATVRPSAACPLQPATATAGGTDGRFQMPAELRNYGPTDVGAFMVIGKEAAAEGRLRDAEIAFLMACRVADRFKGSDSVESANARQQLALHYDNLVREGGPAAPDRGELRRRAELLRPPGIALPAPAPQRPVQTAMQTEQREAETQVKTTAPGPAPAAAQIQPQAQPQPQPHLQPPLQAPKPQARRLEVAQAAPRAPQRASAAPRYHPSFDCAKARSGNEKLICSDARLAQLDSELGYLHARAGNSARSSWAFKRTSEQEWKRREATCRDRECLLHWYAQRRYQLMNEVNSG